MGKWEGEGMKCGRERGWEGERWECERWECERWEGIQCMMREVRG